MKKIVIFLSSFLIFIPNFKALENNQETSNICQKEDQKYYIDNKLYTGFIDKGNKTFWVLNGQIVSKTGWFRLEKDEYYLYPDNTLATGLLKIDNHEYFFDSKGVLTKGLIFYQNHYFYIDGFGKKENGLIKDDNQYYLLKNGQLVRNKWYEEQGYKYYFGTDGKAYQGLKRIANKYYYFGLDATLKTGFQIINKKIYYFDSKGKMVFGKQKIAKQNLVFSNQGYLVNSWVTFNNNTYYAKEDGTLATYWYSLNGIKYFFDGTGKLIMKDAKKVVDVSKHQGNINWNLVKQEQEIGAAIVRIGYGTSYPNEDCVMDSYFVSNIQALKQLDIPFAVYLYSYAIDRESAKSEAQFVINTLNNFGLKNVTVYYDLESNRYTKNLTAKDYEDIITTFISRVRQAGYSAFVYTYTNLAKRKFNEVSMNYVTWIAEYNPSLAFKSDVAGWQYTDHGQEKGFTGLVDLSAWKEW